MKSAQVGDRVVLESTHAGGRRRTGVIMELRREDGRPPYVVCWPDDGREALLFPGPDSRIEPRGLSLLGAGRPEQRNENRPRVCDGVS
jgi:hypothetical protein